MNEKLQQAITAVRNGQENEAQLLLTQVLKEDPQETQAWFLLSTLVDSEQKKKAYLGKVLALDPDHPMAKKMLARFQEESEPVAEELPVEEESPVEEADLVAETLGAIQDGWDDEVVQSEELDETELGPAEDQTPAFDELLESVTETAEEDFDLSDAGLFEAEQPSLADELEQFEVEETAVEEPAQPDWLEEIPEMEPAPAADEEAAQPVDEKPEAVSVKPVAKKQPAPAPIKTNLERQRQFLNGIYYALVIVAVAIFLLLLVQIWQFVF